jgi:hypothetical protein
MRKLFLAIVATLAVLTSLRTSACAQSGAELTRELYKQVLADPFDEALFSRFLERSPSITISDRQYYVLEGDLALTKEQARAAILFQAQGSQPASTPSGELLVMVSGGSPVFWPRGERELTYAINRATFPSENVYQLVVSSMQDAAQAWATACPECGVSFRHRAEFDGGPSPSSVTFDVQFDKTARDYIASSFFPNDPLYKRVLSVAPSYLTTTFDKVGVFRHELGHILGYRHEHIRGISGCFQEDNSWKPMTDYDPHSVMHYYCGGGGTMTFELSETDKAGHRALYQ